LAGGPVRHGLTVEFNIEAILLSTDAHRLAESLRTEFVGAKAASPLDRIAARLGCTIEEHELGAVEGGVQADLTPDAREDRFLIRVDPRPRRGWAFCSRHLRSEVRRRRRRFRVAHELGHTFFYSRTPGRQPQRRAPWTRLEEDFCDDFARALLIPSEAVARYYSPTAESVFAAQSRFDVSLEVAARAFASAWPGMEIAVWYWPEEQSAPAPHALLRQWTTAADAPSLGRWRGSVLVNRALRGGTARGFVQPLSRNQSRKQRATACSDHRLRQLILTTQTTAADPSPTR
jgi:hypothetical protein